MDKTLIRIRIVILFVVFFCTDSYSSVQSFREDPSDSVTLQEYKRKLAEIEKQRISDSIKRSELEMRLNEYNSFYNSQIAKITQQLKEEEEKDKQRISGKTARIDSLRPYTLGCPVVGMMNDTLFWIYSKIGASTPQERAANISQKIKRLYNDEFLKVDSIVVMKSEYTYDLLYGDQIIMSLSENDAIWSNRNLPELANDCKNKITDTIKRARKENEWLIITLRLGLVLLVIVLAWLVIWLIAKGYAKLIRFISRNKEKWMKDLTYQDYTFLTNDQQLRILFFLVKVSRWVLYAILLYITLPVIFSIFPFSRTWADALFHLIWTPFKGILLAVWGYLPNLFTILVIYFVMKYVIRLISYIFKEIASEKLVISGFHPEWAIPTSSIIKFLLYAFMFVLIFPYLPGSDSNVFKGVSVFIGVLFSLGSSSAISNIIAGLVITYMRPFHIGDRIKIGEVTGDVIEKTLLTTRIKTIKNEIVTIPNSFVLSGNTKNYSSDAKEYGLIIHTTVTIGYDVPWRDMHKALTDAALRTDMILKDPAPFVLQTSLDDFYVSYQINAYTKEAGKQSLIYSFLHQNIQDVCNERGIEILSPHYRSARDGNKTTIPDDYLPEDYKAPKFRVRVKTRKKDQPE